MPKLKDTTVAWICPLEVEAQAAAFMLDEYYEDFDGPTGQRSTLQYIMGKMCGQDIVIVRLPEGEVGIGPATYVTTEMSQELPALKVVFLVGIGAGLPSASKDRDIRLGDVAVATPGDNHSGIIHYTLKKVTDNGEVMKGHTNSTSRQLRNVIGKIRSTSFISKRSFLDHLKQVQDRPGAESFRRPADIQPCPDNNFPLVRPSGNDPLLHLGTILSGDEVVKNKERRDALREKHDAICIEMEAAGLMNDWPAIVIRGISDFGDGSKNDVWHKYASMTAAACAKEVLRILNLGPVEKEDTLGLHKG